MKLGYETETEIITPNGTRLYRHKDHSTLEAARDYAASQDGPSRIYDVRLINGNRYLKFPVAA